MMGGGFMHGGLGLIGPLFMLALFALTVVLIVLGVIWLVKSQQTPTVENNHAKKEALLNALKQTYASGRIDTKEFEERKKILEI